MTNTAIPGLTANYNHPRRSPIGSGHPIRLHRGIAVILTGPRAGRTVVDYTKRGC